MTGSRWVSRAELASHAEVRSRRFRIAASVAVAVTLEKSEPDAPRPVRRSTPKSGWVPLGLRDPSVRWDELPARVVPEDWTTGHSDAPVPGALLVAETERQPEGYHPAG